MPHHVTFCTVVCMVSLRARVALPLPPLPLLLLLLVLVLVLVLLVLVLLLLLLLLLRQSRRGRRLTPCGGSRGSRRNSCSSLRERSGWRRGVDEMAAG